MAPHIVGIVQARMGSTRLPGKTLIDICGKPFLHHILGRMQRSRKLENLVVATTTKREDDVICELCHGLNIACFRGSEDDVLDRYYQCAKAHNANIIVRITADDPFKDPEVADRIIEEILQDDELDYVSNTIRPTYPEGLDIEVFRFRALERHGRKRLQLWIESMLPPISGCTRICSSLRTLNMNETCRTCGGHWIPRRIYP